MVRKKYLCIIVLCIHWQLQAVSEDYALLEESVRILMGKIEELEQKCTKMQEEIQLLRESLLKKENEDNEKWISELVMPKPPNDIIKIAKELINDNENVMEKARKILRCYINKKPNIYRGMMEFYIGESYFKENDYKHAAYEYMNSYKTNKNGKKTAEALYHLALCFERLSKKDEAIKTINKIVNDYSSSKEVLEKAKRLRSNLIKDKNVNRNR